MYFLSRLSLCRFATQAAFLPLAAFVVAVRFDIVKRTHLPLASVTLFLNNMSFHEQIVRCTNLFVFLLQPNI